MGLMGLKKTITAIFTVLLSLGWAIGVNAADRFSMSYIYFENTIISRMTAT